MLGEHWVPNYTAPVDTWDGEDGPVVYNGYTNTGRLDFVDVVKTIAANGKHETERCSGVL